MNQHRCRSFDSNSIQVKCSSLALSSPIYLLDFVLVALFVDMTHQAIIFTFLFSFFVKCSFVYLSFRVRSVDQFRRTTTTTLGWMKWSQRLCNEQFNKADNILLLVVWSKGKKMDVDRFLRVNIFPCVWKWPFPFSHSQISFALLTFP